MGFDLNGLKPKGTKISRPERPEDLFGNCSQIKQENYFNELSKYQSQEGTYFRNNVWWWRPLADYVIEFTKVVPNDKKHQEGWQTNSGFIVSDSDAVQISKQLDFLIKSGHTKQFSTKYKKIRLNALQYNKRLQKEMDKLNNLPRNKDLAPKDYNQADKKKWDKLWNKKLQVANYPFSVENVKEFSNFCKSSGGFEIC